MNRVSKLAAFAAATTVWFGCAPAATPATHGTTSSAAIEPSGGGASVAVADEPEATEEQRLAAFDASGLPAAPWSSEPLASDAVPQPLLSAWSQADNREACAPLAPASFGPVEGASARVSRLIEGGWAVEFDQRGMPGMTADGESCESCGRGVFGIAGTNLPPDALIGEDEDLEAPSPSFADGSHLSVEPPAEGESVAAATITVRGQGCVYQVWSFLGEEHVRQLVSDLRLVDVGSRRPARVAAR